MHRRTKIICTMGPAVDSLEKILELIDAGMNVARLNFSHGTHETHLRTIGFVKQAREMRGLPIAIMLDTKGPEIRVGKIKDGAAALEMGQELFLVGEEIEGTSERIQIMPELVLDGINVGDQVLFDDGYIISEVVRKSQEGVYVKILNPGMIKTNKGVNIPGVAIDLPAMTEKDVADIIFGCKNDIDCIAASFIRSADHILEIKKLLVEQGKGDTLILAKIENRLGVDNFDSIIQVADGIMIARGDLGVELPLKEVPILQKMMIRKCYQASKPVVTATQMLESMIKNPRPTRAEVSDVANAIFDSTSAVMLSGESAMGAYPIEAVKMMKSIVEETEKEFNYREFFYVNTRSNYNDVSTSIALATVKTAYSLNAKAIFTYTNSGQIVRLLSRFRPKMPILAVTSNAKVYYQMALNWGVIAVKPTPCSNVREAFSIMSDFATEKKLVKYGDLVILTSGDPFGIRGTTNMMIVDSIGDVLVRASPGEGNVVHGRVAIVLSPHEKKRAQTKDRIVVIPRCDDSYLPLLSHAIGVILHNHPEDIKSERNAMQIAKSLGLPIVVRADAALNFLEDGQLVTLDPQTGRIYRGKS
jgi:pyruvate kinase